MLKTKRAKYQREYRRNHQKELWAEHGGVWSMRRSNLRKQLRVDTFAAYGNKCVCCGEAQIEFLTIDHINGRGGEERRKLGIQGGTQFYRWLQRNSWPKENYQLLCYNCNCAKAYTGTCPHSRGSALLKELLSNV